MEPNDSPRSRTSVDAVIHPEPSPKKIASPKMATPDIGTLSIGSPKKCIPADVDSTDSCGAPISITVRPPNGHEPTGPTDSTSTTAQHQQNASISSCSTTGDSALGHSITTTTSSHSKHNSLDRRCDEITVLEEDADYKERQMKANGSPKKITFGSLFSRKPQQPSSQSSAPSLACQAQPSTSGLILQMRPGNLPPKSAEEERKHREQHEKILEAARKKEEKDAKERKKQEAVRLKQEEKISNVSHIWLTNFLPNWHTAHKTKKCRELWWNGLPPNVRGKVWSLVLGNPSNITNDLYKICCDRAHDKLAEQRIADEASKTTSPSKSGDTSALDSAVDCTSSSVINRENTIGRIYLDVRRTFPALGLFQPGGPYHDELLNLLCAYVCYRPDVGYVQSMSYLAAILLLNMDALSAFVAFANLLNEPLHRAFFGVRQPAMTYYFIAFDRYMTTHLPTLHAYFDKLDVRPDLYLIEWLYTMYAKTLPLDVACRVWDVYFRDGEDVLFHTALGLLNYHESALMTMEFDAIATHLTTLPQHEHDVKMLFQCIHKAQNASVSTDTKLKSFSDILRDVQTKHSADRPITDMLHGCTPSKTHTRNASNLSNVPSIGSSTGNANNGGYVQLNGDVSEMGKSTSGFLTDWLKNGDDAAEK